ncbi:MAG TPA: hypothetical protein VFN54_08815 [Acidimicrobiales bacterium]|nr:hypothetical protein [Acidimicrobiales bacterium]
MTTDEYLAELREIVSEIEHHSAVYCAADIADPVGWETVRQERNAINALHERFDVVTEAWLAGSDN